VSLDRVSVSTIDAIVVFTAVQEIEFRTVVFSKEVLALSVVEGPVAVSSISDTMDFVVAGVSSDSAFMSSLRGASPVFSKGDSAPVIGGVVATNSYILRKRNIMIENC
jgi:hypothetical protein